MTNNFYAFFVADNDFLCSHKIGPFLTIVIEQHYDFFSTSSVFSINF